MFNKIKNMCTNNISILIFFIGIFIYCYPIIFSLGTLFVGGISDSILNNSILEHGWLFINQHEAHTSFFDIPMFFPHTNTLAYTDMLVGGMFVYIPIRTIIKNPIMALQIWFIILSIFNYYSMYFLLNKIFKLNKLPSSIGALLFAFGLPRQNQIGHIQFQTQFYMILSVIAFLSINKDKSKLFNNMCLFFCSIFFVIQIYSSFYLGWYMVYGFVIYILILLFSNKLRYKLFNFIKKYKYEIILYILFTFILLIPLLKHYLAVEAKWDMNEFFDIRIIFPYNIILSYNHINTILFNGYISNILSQLNTSYVMGIGLITSIFVFIGILFDKTNRLYIFLFCFIALIFFTNISLNNILYIIFPGASVIRVGERIIFLLLPIYSYYLAFIIQKLSIINRKYLLIILFIILEQIYNFSDYSYEYYLVIPDFNKKINEYKIPNNCNIYYNNYDYYNKDDYTETFMVGFSKGINKNKYYINGYSGYIPTQNPSYAVPACIIESKI